MAYKCPQCSQKRYTKNETIRHIRMNHPDSADYINFNDSAFWTTVITSTDSYSGSSDCDSSSSDESGSSTSDSGSCDSGGGY